MNWCAKMTDVETKSFLHPLTFEAQCFLKSLEKYGPQYKFVDEELLNTMDKLADAIKNFYEQKLTKIEENDSLKLIKPDNFEYIVRTYKCFACQKHLGDAIDKVARHICNYHGNKNKPKVTKKREKTGQPIELTLPKKARSLVLEKMSKVFKETLETAKQMKQLPEYERIEKDLRDTIEPIYPDKQIKLYKFGSRICGIGNRNSDLDIFVEIGDTFNTFENRASGNTLKAITKVSNALHAKSEFKHCIAIHNARVPIIKVEHKETQIQIDIGFSNSLGHCNTLLLEYIFDLQPLAARMCIYLKKWMERTKLNENISSYTITLMVVYYLQLFKALPSVELMQKDLSEPKLVGPWIGNFHRQSLDEFGFEPEVFTKASIREHLYNFFALYADFDFDKQIVCPFKGEQAFVKDIKSQMPQRYTDFVASNGSQVELILQKPIVVQDPIQLNHNVAKNISKALLRVVVAYFKDSAKLLSSENAFQAATGDTDD